MFSRALCSSEGHQPAANELLCSSPRVKHPEYTSRRRHKASSSRPSLAYVHARLPCMTECYCSDAAAPQHGQIRPSTDNASLVFRLDIPVPTGSSQGPEAGPSPAAPRAFQHAQPSAHCTTPYTSARTGYRRTTATTLIHFVQIILRGPPPPKSWPAPPSTTRAQPAVLMARTSAHETLLRLPMPVQMKHVCPWYPPRTPPRPIRPPLLLICIVLFRHQPF